MLYLFKFKSIHFGEKKIKMVHGIIYNLPQLSKIAILPRQKSLILRQPFMRRSDLQLYNLARGILKWENYKKKQLASSPLLLFSFVS